MKSDICDSIFQIFQEKNAKNLYEYLLIYFFSHL
jgi:hypothetical protein